MAVQISAPAQYEYKKYYSNTLSEVPPEIQGYFFNRPEAHYDTGIESASKFSNPETIPDNKWIGIEYIPVSSISSRAQNPPTMVMYSRHRLLSNPLVNPAQNAGKRRTKRTRRHRRR